MTKIEEKAIVDKINFLEAFNDYIYEKGGKEESVKDIESLYIYVESKRREKSEIIDMIESLLARGYVEGMRRKPK